MMTKIRLTALALAAATLTVTAFDGVQAARLMSSPVTVARVAALPHVAGPKFVAPRFAGVVDHIPAPKVSHKPPPPGCYPRADCVGNGNHGPTSPVNGGYGVTEGGNGQNGGGLDGWDGGGGDVWRCFSDIRCHSPN
jgi:hypothetical protein